MVELDPAPRVLGFMLGLGDLNEYPPCMGYQNACVCDECLERASTLPRLVVRQPWELDAA